MDRAWEYYSMEISHNEISVSGLLIDNDYKICRACENGVNGFVMKASRFG